MQTLLEKWNCFDAESIFICPYFYAQKGGTSEAIKINATVDFVEKAGCKAEGSTPTTNLLGILTKCQSH